MKDDSHPRIIILGAGPVKSASEENANQNIAQLVRDVDLEGITCQRDVFKDYGKGRFAYQLSCAKRTVEVQMPGCPLNSVRFLGEQGQNIFDFPRLYLDGSSVVWKYAVGIIQKRIK